jgi:hypothetical protein
MDPELDVNFGVRDLIAAIYRVDSNTKGVMADTFYQGYHGDEVNNIDCLLGNDALCHMRHFTFSDCIKGRMINTCHGKIPFGPVSSFFDPPLSKEFYEDQAQPVSVAKSQVKNS